MKNCCFQSEDFRIAETIPVPRSEGRLLRDWLGESGTPVPLELAEYRALVCADCYANRAVLWGNLKPQSVSVLRSYQSMKESLGLGTSTDDELGTCVACKCFMAFKVWSPIKHIQETTGRDIRHQLLATNDKCWILQELFKLRDARSELAGKIL